MKTDFLFTALLVIILFVLLIIAYRTSESTKIKQFKRLIMKNYKVNNATYVKRTLLLGDTYYVFKTNRGFFTVSENGIISNVKL